MAMSEYSLSDIATASRENGFGGDTAGCMIILFAMIFGRGGNGFGFGNRGPAGEPVTEAGLCNAMNFNGLENAVWRLSDQQAAIARQNDNAICSLGYQTLEQPSKPGATVRNGFNQMQSCRGTVSCSRAKVISMSTPASRSRLLLPAHIPSRCSKTASPYPAPRRLSPRQPRALCRSISRQSCVTSAATAPRRLRS